VGKCLVAAKPASWTTLTRENRVKRGGAAGHRRAAFEFDDLAKLSAQVPEEIVRFDQVFRRLETESPDGAAVVRLGTTRV